MLKNYDIYKFHVSISYNIRFMPRVNIHVTLGIM